MEHAQTKLLIPGLRPFYAWAEPLSWALVRITAGLMIIPHGWPKLILIVLETLGGLCVALGLVTRFFAAAITIEMAVIVYHSLPKFGWTERGYEYPLMWGLIMLAIALRGGGPYSLDRKLGREL